jgi:hypothetical protein
MSGRDERVRAKVAEINSVADGSRERPYATPVAFSREVSEVVMARAGEMQREVLRQLNRLSERFGRTREGLLFTSGVALSIAAVARDMANNKFYGGEPRVHLPQAMIDGVPRSEVIEALLIEQADEHARRHRTEEPGDHAPPSRCNVCAYLGKLSLPVATDEQVGTEVKDAPAPTEPAVLIFKGEMEDVRAVLRATGVVDGTRRYSWYAGSALDELRMADRNELHAILFGGFGS